MESIAVKRQHIRCTTLGTLKQLNPNSDGRFVSHTLLQTGLSCSYFKTTKVSQIRILWCTIAVILLKVTTVKSEGTHIWKCCFKEEQLHTNGRDCVPRTGKRVDPLSNIHNESTLELERSRSHDLYWLPSKLMDRDLSVHYAGTFSCDRFLVLNANDTSLISFGEEMNVTLRVNNTQSTETIFQPADYCLDATDGPTGPWAIRMCIFNILPQIVKCCPQGHIIAEEAGTPHCVENLNIIMNGSKEIVNMNINPLFAYNSYSLCFPGQFQLLDGSNMSWASQFRYLLGGGSFEQGYLRRYPCLDGRAGVDGGLQWTRGICSYAAPHYAALLAPTYFSVPAAALLAAAVAATLAQAHTRASTHGRALACHAGALLAANACNAAFAFSQQLCQPLAIAINFFLLAAAFWLQVICINMARGFSQMLRNKRAVDHKTCCAQNVRAFCLYSLYAWGCPLIATIVIVSTVSEFSEPLYHTKTCFFEEGSISTTRKTDRFFYYYAPMCIILLMNIAMFAFTALKIRAVRKDTDILDRKEDGQPSGTRASAVLYVKLLLVMGVVETAADVAAWATKNSGVHVPDGSRLTDKDFVFLEFSRRELTYRCVAYTLDLLRAASIFAVCCCGRQTRAKARAACARWMPCCARAVAGTARTAGTAGTTGTAERTSASNMCSISASAPAQLMRCWLSRVLRPFRRRVQPDSAFSSPGLSMETVVSTLDEEPRRVTESQARS